MIRCIDLPKVERPTPRRFGQIDKITGRFAGTTSFAGLDPVLRTLTIGYTRLGRRWWGTGANAEAKPLMLTFAFESLGAVRVAMVTDIRNARAQAAIERLGAGREGVLRKHRRRADGSWRDTVTYAITDDDGETVKHDLKARLQTYHPVVRRLPRGSPASG
jgi:N-acetyltransferase